MPSTRTNVNRLLRLADFLRTLPKEEFDMSVYVRAVDDPDADYEPNPVRKPRPGCGTACCIGGWAARFHPDLYLDEGYDLHLKGESLVTSEYAFAMAFGTTLLEADALLCWDAPHQTPKGAARAVEKLARAIAERNGYEVVEVDDD